MGTWQQHQDPGQTVDPDVFKLGQDARWRELLGKKLSSEKGRLYPGARKSTEVFHVGGRGPNIPAIVTAFKGAR